jgi:CRP/FNR family transcriptional regulator
MTAIDEISEFRSSPELKEKLQEYCMVKDYQSGDIILNENSTIRSIPLVTKGSVRVMRTDDEGREILLYYIKAGESCIMSFLGGLHHETSKVRVEVEEAAEIYFLPIDKVNTFINEYPQWLNYIFRQYHNRFEELLDVVNAIAFKKVDERLLLLLKKKVTVTGNKVLLVSHEQIANELATARAVVSRLLKQLEEQGKVILGRNKITLLEI